MPAATEQVRLSPTGGERRRVSNTPVRPRPIRKEQAMKRILISAGLVAAAGAVVAGVVRSARRPSAYAVGAFANGMQETRFGNGDRTLLWIPDPSHTSPTGPYLRFMAKALAPIVAAGYCVHLVARKPHLAADVTATDLARDYASLIDSDFAGRVDLVVADSQGGVIGYCLAALRPDLCHSLATVAASYLLNPAAREATVESARLLREGQRLSLIHISEPTRLGMI